MIIYFILDIFSNFDNRDDVIFGGSITGLGVDDVLDGAGELSVIGWVV